MKKILYVIFCCLFMTAVFIQGVVEMRSPLPVLPSI